MDKMIRLKFVGANTGLYDIISVSEIILISRYKFKVKTLDLDSSMALLKWHGDVVKWGEDSLIKFCSPFYDNKRNVIVGCDEYFGCVPVSIYNTLSGQSDLFPGTNIPCYVELAFDYKKEI